MSAQALTSAQDRADKAFRAHFGGEPDGTVFAPGRVNLIGEHVDYNGGLVLPMPISVGTTIAWRARNDGRINAIALEEGGTEDHFALTDPHALTPFDWRSYLRGMAACSAERGLATGGADMVIAGSIPRGAGLSSSASFCVAVGRTLALAAGDGAPAPTELALAAQQAEHRYAGVKCGIMDQLAVAAGTPGSAVLIDCRSLETRLVALPGDWAVMIVQSGVSRGLVDGHYNSRRADCETAAEAIGVDLLRDASPLAVEQAVLSPMVRARARHVVEEIARTSAAVDAVAAADIVTLGQLFAQSHASMRDLFEITVPAVDRLVEILSNAIGPAGGARMTGGGFGGAVVAVLERSRVDAVRAIVAETYRTPDGQAPLIMLEPKGA